MKVTKLFLLSLLSIFMMSCVSLNLPNDVRKTFVKIEKTINVKICENSLNYVKICGNKRSQTKKCLNCIFVCSI